MFTVVIGTTTSRLVYPWHTTAAAVPGQQYLSTTLPQYLRRSTTTTATTGCFSLSYARQGREHRRMYMTLWWLLWT